MKKRFIALTVVLLLLLQMIGVGANGFVAHATDFSGYTAIYTKQDLNNIKNNLSGNYYLANDIEFTDVDFSSGGAFYNNGEGWQAIGAGLTPFSGIFDGNHYKIIGLKIYGKTTGSQSYAGLFGYNTGQIKNLGLVNDYINVKSCSYIGAVAAYSWGTIYNCYNTGSICVNPSATTYVGGIVGGNYGSVSDCYNIGSVGVSSSNSSSAARAGGIMGINNVSVWNCFNTGDISIKCMMGYSAGGIAGSNDAIDIPAEINDCYNTGNIYAKSGGHEDEYSSIGNVGGIVGSCLTEAIIRNCYNIGQYKSDNTTAKVAGITFKYQTTYTDTVLNCYYIGQNTQQQMQDQATYVGFDFINTWVLDTNGSYNYPALKNMPHVFALDNTVNFVGGTGTAENPYKISTKTQLNNMRMFINSYYKLINDIVFTASDFTSGGEFYQIISGSGAVLWQPIGNFKGVFDGCGYTIKGLKISGNVTYVGLFGINSGTIKNVGLLDINYTVQKNNGGGIVASNAGLINNCYVTGSISATASGYTSLAGICVGNSGTISNCYNKASISAMPIYNEARAGGIAVSGGTIINCYNAGAIYANASTRFSGTPVTAYAGGISAEDSSVITNCYNVGSVIAIAGLPENQSVAGIVGYNTYSGTAITNCYYIDTNSIGIGNGTDSTIKKTTAEMQQQSTFAGFDFDTAWTMGGSADYAYPELQSSIKPVITLGTYSTDLTENSITVTATADKGTLNADSYTFTKNGSFTFIATDSVGNVTNKTVTISNIVMMGDVNASGNISSIDALYALQISTGKKSPTEYQFHAADVNKNGSVTSIDALRILQYSTGKITSFQ